MALTSTIYTLGIDLSDTDRHVYEHLDLRLARHPSESAEYFVARILAYCLEYRDGIAMTDGLSDGDQPPVIVRPLLSELFWSNAERVKLWPATRWLLPAT